MDIKHIPQVFEAPIGTLSDPAHRRRFYPPSCCHHDRTACVGHIKPCFLTAVYPGAQSREEPGETSPVRFTRDAPPHRGSVSALRC